MDRFYDQVRTPSAEDREQIGRIPFDEAGYREWRQGSALGRIPFMQLRRSLAVARANLDRRDGD